MQDLRYSGSFLCVFLFLRSVPQTNSAGLITLVSWVGYFAPPFPFRRDRGVSLVELCRGDSLLHNPGVPACKTPCPCKTHTRLKSLKWNSLKMASLPSTSFHPTARRFGSSCSLSSVLSLWAFPAWHHGKEGEEEPIRVAEVG